MRAVDGVSLTLDQGEVLGVVGESGSGKSVTMLALMGLVPFPGRVRADRLSFGGRDLLTMSDRERRQLTGKDVAMIFQEPTTSLNPCFTDRLPAHRDAAGSTRAWTARPPAAARSSSSSRSASRRPRAASRAFPHQLSGGMNQRVMIAMAIACNPRLLIADEPTTALDVTIQAQILDLLLSLQKERGMALVLITHNMGVVAETAQRVMVMYAGQIMEERRGGRPLRGAAAPLYGGARSRRCRSAARAVGSPPSRASCPGLYDRPRRLPVLAALRLSRPSIRARCGRSCAPWAGGRIRCHYPLGRPRAGPRDPRRPSRRSGGRAVSAPVVVADNLKRTYEIRRGLFREPARLQAVGGVSFQRRARAHAGGRRRIRLRQVDPRPHGHADRASRPRAALDPRWPRRRQAAAGRGDAAAPHRPARLPEPLRLPQPAQEGRLDPGGAARHQHGAPGRGAHRPARAR